MEPRTFYRYDDSPYLYQAEIWWLDQQHIVTWVHEDEPQGEYQPEPTIVSGHNQPECQRQGSFPPELKGKVIHTVLRWICWANYGMNHGEPSRNLMLEMDDIQHFIQRKIQESAEHAEIIPN
jgi:hypothetical protein